jgi:hypothetical protein
MSKFYDVDGNELDGFLADEVKTQVDAGIETAKGEFSKIESDLKTENERINGLLNSRKDEFSNFRKLNDDVVAKLGVAERTIYENGLALQKSSEDRINFEKKIYDSTVDTAIRAKSGSDEKLFTKMKDMWGVIGVNANTPEEIESKTRMIIGAISTTEPDLLASVSGFSGGSWKAPSKDDDKEKSFADSERGKAGAVELGLKL